jgi:hypothetical protein
MRDEVGEAATLIDSSVYSSKSSQAGQSFATRRKPSLSASMLRSERRPILNEHDETNLQPPGFFSIH